ncbi:hypothetical protein HPP92_000641 [Vanilla planifolia]|uniref:SRR1-like domain-containing protein n=1 Tax=Vanilla planifolia TaxID=51239 RepID=A0A835RP85_VANPL|nr:hypothetical protein HPP92_000641 [Vanilla planifolia]
MQSSIRRLEKSQFFRRFLCRMRSPLIQECLDKLLVSCSRIQIVAYGIGSIESYEVPRLQLALAILLMQELGVRVAGSIEVFDPILSSVECAVVAALGCTVVSVDEGGRREATVPTLFYMPHCELVLYDSLLEANWKPAMLKRLVVLGNSFGVYERCANERVGAGSVPLEVQGRHVLGSRRYVREVEMEDTEYFPKENDEEDFFEAFHDISWHFFDLQDDAKL